MCEPQGLTTLWTFKACYRVSFTFTFYNFSYVEVAVYLHFIPWYLMEGNYLVIKDVSSHFEF
jgi:hypothetical protein